MGKIIGLTFEKPAVSVECVCPHCGKAYKTEDGLQKHIKDKHPAADDKSAAAE